MTNAEAPLTYALPGARLVWEKRAEANPTARLGAGLAYDRERAETLMFGGRSGALTLAQITDTWAWDGTRWSLRYPEHAPTGADEWQMSYHAASKRTLLVGGGDAQTKSWWWDGQDWTPVCSTVNCLEPSGRLSAALAYDSARARVLLTGGMTSQLGPIDEMWSFDGSAWLPVSVAGVNLCVGQATTLVYAPPPIDRALCFVTPSAGTIDVAAFDPVAATWTLVDTITGIGAPSSAVYDERIGDVLLFGADGTWRWNIDTHEETLVPTPTGLLARQVAPMAYDSLRQRSVIATGGDEGITFGDVWEFREEWTQLAVAGLSGRGRPFLAFDPHRGVTVQLSSDGGPQGQTWEWDSQQWRQKTSAGALGVGISPLAFDGVRGAVMFFGGFQFMPTPSDRTMTFDGVGWTERCTNIGTCPVKPPARRDHGIAYDPDKRVVLVYGGSDSGGELQDLWSWTGTTWSERCLAPCASPSFDGAPSLMVTAAYDGGRHGLAVARHSRLYLYDEPASDPNGRWTRLADVPLRAEGSLLYDPTIARLLWFTSGADEARVEVFALNVAGDAWEPLAPVEGDEPLGRDFLPVTYDRARGRTILFGGSRGLALPSLGLSPIVLGDTWELHLRGQSCTSGSECETGFCTEGVCCETISCGTCQSCAADAARGICTSRAIGEEDPGSCDGGRVCGPADHCGAIVGASCVTSDDCAFFPCVDGRCVGPRASGSLCEQDLDCASLRCTDGICCSSVCVGRCLACDQPSPVSGAVDGICRAAIGRDPHGDCIGTSAACAGTCQSDATCSYPAESLRCDACSVCDGNGTCAAVPPSGGDDDCAAIDCAASFDTECRHYAQGPVGQCVALGRCLSARDPGACDRYTNVIDGELCSIGRCVRGECVEISKGDAPDCSFAAHGQGPRTWPTCVLFFLIMGFARRRAQVLITSGVFVLAFASRVSTASADEVGVWQEPSAAVPSARTGHDMAYDVLRARTVMYGGGFIDTWEWDGDRWRRIVANTKPSTAGNAAMAYDGPSGLVLRVALEGAQPATWSWDGVEWTRVCLGEPQCGISATQAAGMMTTQGPTAPALLFGGNGAGGEITWLWSGSQWQPVASTGPSKRTGAALVYDSQRDVVVLFGGQAQTGTQRQTWEWNGSAWNEIIPLTTTAPILINSNGVDTGTGVVMLASGRLITGSFTAISEAVWLWNGLDWQQSTSMPVAAENGAHAYDSGRGRVVIHGGNSGFAGGARLFEYDGAGWLMRADTMIPARWKNAFAYHRSLGKSLVYGGISGGALFIPEVWQWDGAIWTQLPNAPVGDSNVSMVFDEARDEMLLLTGAGAFGLTAQLYAFKNGIWSLRCDACNPKPARRHGYGFVYDSIESRALVYGGSPSEVGPFFADFWAWNGASWTSLAAGPGERASPLMAFDRSKNEVILVGGVTDANVFINDMWIYRSDGLWHPGPASPVGDRTIVVYYNEVLARIELLSRSFDRWYFDGSAWIQIVDGSARAARPPDRLGTTSTYDVTRGRLVIFGGDSGGNAQFGDTWELHTRGQACSSSIACETGFCVDGVCCESALCGSCAACSSVGVCKPVSDAPDDSCSGTLRCSAASVCLLEDGQSCAANGECAHDTCYAGTCVPARAQAGQSCASMGDCSDGLSCVDGVCCLDGCTGPCRRCDSPNPATGERDGLCRAVFGVDPDSDCGGSSVACAGTCGGEAGCEYPGADHICGLCLGCDEHGACALISEPATHVGCVAPNCGEAPTCKRYPDAVKGYCVAAGQCRDEATGCARLEDLEDGTACGDDGSGYCQAGACVIEDASIAGCACQLSAAKARAPGIPWIILGMIVVEMRRRSRRRSPALLPRR